MDETQRIVRFAGGVQCRQEKDLPALTLIGRTADGADEAATVVFSFAATLPPQLPQSLQDVTVDRVDPNRFRVRSAEQEWIVAALACHLHRDVSISFYRAIPPRRPPWSKRLLWRLVLALAAHPLGKRLLRAAGRR